MSTVASLQSWLAIKPILKKSQQRVFDAACQLYATGFTLNDISRLTGMGLHQFSSRVSELKELGWFVETGERRDGQTVYKIGDGTTPGTKKPRATKKSGQVIDTRLIISGGLLVTIRVDKAVDAPEIGSNVDILWT